MSGYAPKYLPSMTSKPIMSTNELVDVLNGEWINKYDAPNFKGKQMKIDAGNSDGFIVTHPSGTYESGEVLDKSKIRLLGGGVTGTISKHRICWSNGNTWLKLIKSDCVCPTCDDCYCPSDCCPKLVIKIGTCNRDKNDDDKGGENCGSCCDKVRPIAPVQSPPDKPMPEIVTVAPLQQPSPEPEIEAPKYTTWASIGTSGQYQVGGSLKSHSGEIIPGFIYNVNNPTYVTDAHATELYKKWLDEDPSRKQKELDALAKKEGFQNINDSLYSKGNSNQNNYYKDQNKIVNTLFHKTDCFEKVLGYSKTPRCEIVPVSCDTSLINNRTIPDGPVNRIYDPLFWLDFNDGDWKKGNRTHVTCKPAGPDEYYVQYKIGNMVGQYPSIKIISNQMVMGDAHGGVMYGTFNEDHTTIHWKGASSDDVWIKHNTGTPDIIKGSIMDGFQSNINSTLQGNNTLQNGGNTTICCDCPTCPKPEKACPPERCPKMECTPPLELDLCLNSLSDRIYLEKAIAKLDSMKTVDKRNLINTMLRQIADYSSHVANPSC